MLAHVLVAALAPSPFDESDGLVLHWDAPTHCPDAAAVEQRARDLLTAAQVEIEDVRLHARAGVVATSTGYALVLRIEGEQAGERRLEAESCDELAQAAALILAVAMDPSANVTPSAAPPSVEPQPVVDEAPAPSVDIEARGTLPPEIPDDRPAPASPSIGVRGGVGIDALAWRPIGASLALGAAVIGRGYRVELTARYAAPSIAVASSNPSVQARTQQWSVGLGACGVPVFGARRRIELPLCAAFEAGAMHARGRGTAIDGRGTTAPWLAASAGPTLLGRITDRVALSLGVDAIVLFSRPRFVTDQGTVALQPRRAGLRALVGVEFRFEVRSR